MKKYMSTCLQLLLSILVISSPNTTEGAWSSYFGNIYEALFGNGVAGPVLDNIMVDGRHSYDMVGIKAASEKLSAESALALMGELNFALNFESELNSILPSTSGINTTPQSNKKSTAAWIHQAMKDKENVEAPTFVDLKRNELVKREIVQTKGKSQAI